MSTFLIELTDGFMNDKGEFLYRAVGCNTLVFDENGVNNILHPIDIPELKEESRKEGYHQGFKDGKNQAITELPELANHENEIYDKGYQQALKDFENLYIYEYDFKEFFKHAFEGRSLYDAIVQNGACAVLSYFKVWKEHDERIKIGDYIKDKNNDRIGIVLSIGEDCLMCYEKDFGVYWQALDNVEKYGKNVADKIQTFFDQEIKEQEN